MNKLTNWSELKKYLTCSSFLLSFLLISCNSKEQNIKAGVVQENTIFYKEDGTTGWTFHDEIMYRDSVVIMVIRGADFTTDSKNVITAKYPLRFYKFIDLRRKVMYYYRTLSDTATIVYKSPMYDSLMLDDGWTFYSWKYPKILGSPALLPDTVIDNVKYKRERMHFIHSDTAKKFKVGYFRCDVKDLMFSLEKEYSQSKGCVLVKFMEYIKKDTPLLFASREVEFLRDSLSQEENRIFTCWENNVNKYPVRNEKPLTTEEYKKLLKIIDVKLPAGK